MTLYSHRRLPLDPAKVDKDFECLVKELGLSEEKQQEMHDYSMEKKMSLLVSQHCLQTEDASHFIGFLKNLQQSFVIDSNTIRQLQDLVISLRTQNFSYLESFLSASGLKLLTELLNQCHQQYTLEQPALFFLYALRALLNSPNGRAAVLHDEQHVLVSIARAVDFRDFKCKTGNTLLVFSLHFFTFSLILTHKSIVLSSDKLLFSSNNPRGHCNEDLI
ncbi:hypothetical protein CAEBREN_28912 [Caenorhabditis brenneri]|uniref:Formin GTPase-binding domain-containing protein n=1 Tax=Caenorhabditis brenneri TaxID=135651 RepID=G0PFQ5_CAEBE|nr:hypothetical protein CAEBREN_28912 [Caenorhabditis brenneri]